MNLFIYVDDFNKSSHHCVNQQVFKQNKNNSREIKKTKTIKRTTKLWLVQN